MHRHDKTLHLSACCNAARDTALAMMAEIDDTHLMTVCEYVDSLMSLDLACLSECGKLLLCLSHDECLPQMQSGCRYRSYQLRVRCWSKVWRVETQREKHGEVQRKTQMQWEMEG